MPSDSSEMHSRKIMTTHFHFETCPVIQVRLEQTVINTMKTVAYGKRIILVYVAQTTAAEIY